MDQANDSTAALRSTGALQAMAEHMHPYDAIHVRRVLAEYERMRKLLDGGHCPSCVSNDTGEHCDGPTISR